MLGSAIVRQLLRDGCAARALVRDPAAAVWLAAEGAELARGDLRDASSLHAAAASCDAVFHAAAAISPTSDYAFFRAGNVDGTQRVVDACADAGARLVYVSSTAVYGGERYARAPVDERFPLPVLDERDAYGRSKQEAERLVLEAHADRRLWAAVVRPPVMYGERDRQFIPRIGPVLARGIFPLIGGGGTTLPVVSATAVAEGAVAAARTDASGGRAYNLTCDFPLTVAELVRYAAVGLGRRIRAPRISHRAGRALFRALELALVAARRRDLAQHAMGTYDMLTHDNPFSEQRARRELAWRPTVPPEVGVPRAFAWWGAHHGRANATR